MSVKQKVLIVDDDRFVQKVLTRALTENYQAETAGSGEEGFEKALSWDPDVILLDVEMPGQNGYEVCDQLKRNAQTAAIPVVFLSSKSSLRERLLGYEVGGDDYLVKPCEAEELLVKLDRITSQTRARLEMQANAQTAQLTAMEALATSFELGKAVRFVEGTYNVGNFDTLGRALSTFCLDLSLSSVAMFICRDGPLFYSSSGKEISPLESEILQMVHQKDRFMDFGCRTQVNYPQVSLLIKNMPLEDRPRYGRIKDILPFVLGAADAKIRVLDAESALLNQNNELMGSIEAVNLALTNARKSFGSNLRAVSTIMSELLATLSIDLNNMGLELDQETWICDKVETASKSVYSCVEQNSDIESTFNDILVMLKKLTDEQSKIISQNLSSSDVPADSASDIELF